MKKTDICYYLSITKEENSAFIVASNQNNNNSTVEQQPPIDGQYRKFNKTSPINRTKAIWGKKERERKGKKIGMREKQIR